MGTSKSIAVLPFRNLSADLEQEYFVDGITEEIINALSQIGELQVTARTSSFAFKNVQQDIRAIGKDLGVSLLLEGSVRTSNSRLRITATLIRSEDGFQVWSNNFDRDLEDVFELQDEISLLIADKIREYLGHLTIQDRLVNINTHNLKAYQYYLKGQYQYNKWDMQGFQNAAKQYEKSIQEDPAFDLPYFGAGLSYSFLGSWGPMDREDAFQIAEDFFSRGNQIPKKSALRYYSVAKHQFWGYWNYQAAHETLMHAYAVQPRDANTNEFMAEVHTLAGNFSVALKYIEISLRIDPLAPSHYYTKANIHYLQGNFSDALRTIDLGLSIVPSFSIGLELRIACLLLLAQKDLLTESLHRRQPVFRDLVTMMYGLLYENLELEPGTVNQMIADLHNMTHGPLLAWDLYLMVCAGHKAEAMELLQSKVNQKLGQVINLKFDPLLQPIRSIPAFRALVTEYFPNHVLLTIGKQTQRDKNILPVAEVKRYEDRLLRAMEEEKYFLMPDLGLKSLAEKINLHPNKLSWLLNEHIGKNFYNFVNHYRLLEFQTKALDPNNQHLNLLGIAYESGFNSKSVFNDFFKRSTGTTPKAWVRQHSKN